MKKKIMAIMIGTIYFLYFASVYAESNFYANILAPVVTLIALHFVSKGYFFREKTRMLKLSGLFLTLSLFAWFFCDVTWLIAESILQMDAEKTSIILSFYSISNALLLIAMLLLAYHKVRNWNRIQVLVDMISISLCIMVLVWVIFLNHDMRNLVIIENDWIAMASIAIDFLICILLAIWIFSIRKGKMPLFLKFESVGCMFFIITDLIYYYEYYFRSYEPNSLIDGAYVIAFVVLAISAVIKVEEQEIIEENEIREAEIREAEEFETAEFSQTKPNSNGGSVKGLILILAPIILIIFNGFLMNYILILFLIIMFYFICSGYVQKNVAQDLYLEMEKRLNSELEIKVEERTKELNDLLIHDVRTGLFNRRYFLKQLSETIASIKEDENIILFHLDLNKYKKIKLVFGNRIAEKLLTEIGKRLTTCEWVKNCTIASYGEDIFTAFAKGMYTYEEGIEIANDLLRMCSDTYQIEEYDIQVTMNAGVSIYPVDAKTMENLIGHADIAMSQSRLKGFNKSMAFDKVLAQVIFEKNKIEFLLKKNYCNDEFSLLYQPQVSCKDGSFTGFEVLLQWQTKDGVLIPPDKFIPIAEDTGIIIPIGYWVMKKAIGQLVDWDKKSQLRPRIIIHVSVKQIIENNFILKIKKILSNYNIQPERLELEITAGLQLDKNPEIVNQLAKIKKAGISIAVSDFGTECSSICNVRNFPINRVKLAKQLVYRINEDLYDAAIVETAVRLAKIAGLQIVAEGIETKEEWECLKSLGCDEGQGSYIAEPMVGEDLYKKWM